MRYLCIICSVFWVMLYAGCHRTDHKDILSQASVLGLRLSNEDRQKITLVFATLDRGGQQEFMAEIERQVARVPFDEKSYHGRLDSLNKYLGLVDDCFKSLSPCALDEESLWLMRLKMISRVNLEIDKCTAEPIGGPYDELSAGTGTFMMQRDYLSQLMKTRFDSIRRTFEDNRLFCAYYHLLADDDRTNWIGRLEKVACRRVVIWDPDNPSVELPRFTSADTRIWLPAKDGKGREYIEHIGNGRTIRMREVRKK